MPGEEEEERRRDSKQEQEQGKTSQHLVLPVPGGLNEGTPASLKELDLPRTRGQHGECGGAGKSCAANGRKRTLSNSPSRERLLRRMRAFELPFGNGNFPPKKKKTAPCVLGWVAVGHP